jgi:DNA-directed RNA polymerase specialized sigma24 family protein
MTGGALSVPRRGTSIRALLDTHADDLAAMARWLARRYGRDAEDVKQDLAVIVLARGAEWDAGTVDFRRWLFWTYRRVNPVRRAPVVFEAWDILADPHDV